MCSSDLKIRGLFKLARLAGIEPTTPWFVAKYSIQLSYSRNKRILSVIAEKSALAKGGCPPPDQAHEPDKRTIMPPVWPGVFSPRGLSRKWLMHQHFINQEAVSPASGEYIDVIDPSDGIAFAHIASGNVEDIDKAVRAARGAYEGAWGRYTAVERGRVLQKLAQLIGDHTDELARTEARDCEIGRAHV